MDSKYSLAKKCKNCGYEFSVNLTKIEAAFSKYVNFASQTPCSKCGSSECSSWSRAIPMIDNELLSIWANDSSLCFFEQDEEIMLAASDNIDLFKQIVLNQAIPRAKYSTLVAALCVIIYDKENGWQGVAQFLKQNQDLVLQAKEFISPYIGKKVFPKIGMKW